MSKNKLEKFAENATFPNFFQPSREELLGGNFLQKGNWHNFFENKNPIVLELGCGRGEYTIGLANLYPEKNFIGIDKKGARMWKGCRYSIDNNMKNVAFVRTQIDNIAYCFDENEISEIWITFPDPQPKKETKRLTSPFFLNKYQRFLQKNASIHLKTDSDLLYQYTLEIIENKNYKIITNIKDIYQQNPLEPTLSIRTYYENMWLKNGLSIKYLSFCLD